MDMFELNKVAGAVLSALLVVFSGKTVLDIAYIEHKPEKPGWLLPVKDLVRTAGPPPAPFDPAQVVSLLPKANPDSGQDSFKKCLACHTQEKAGRNLVGPNLWSIVGRKVAQAQGFPYSEAMKNHGGEWNWQALATYLHDPRVAIPNNKMAFAGVKDDAELADLLVYLRKLSDTPAPLPQ
jgi:cytochrome c